MGNYTDTTALAAAALVAAFLGFLFVVAAYVLSALFLGRIFQKAGVQGQWRAWVPVYNFMVFSKLGDVSPWVPLIGFGAAIILAPLGLGFLGTLLILASTAMAAWRVGLKLQKEVVWVVLYVLLSIVWLGINAYDKSRWNPNIVPSPWAGNGFFADRTVWQGVPVQPGAGAVPPTGYQPPAPPAGYQPPAPPQPPAAEPPAPPSGDDAPRG